MSKLLTYNKDTLKKIQRAINELTYPIEGRVPLKVDGIFGGKSHALLTVLQTHKEVGKVGQWDDATENLIFGFINTKYLSLDDVVKGAARIGCEVAMLRALMQKESMDGGFLPNTRAKILFERHKFYSELKSVKGIDETRRLAADHPDIINPKAGGYLGLEREWPRLEKAMHIHIEAALKSASWGLGQVMGFNHKVVGYKNIFDFFADMQRNEKKQFDAVVSFIVNQSGLKRAFVNKDFETIARLYNGPAYKRNNYDTDLARYYTRLKRWVVKE